MNVKQYKVIYRVDTGERNRFTDVELIVDHLPDMGSVVQIPDGTYRYGRVISVQRIKK